MNCKKIEKTKKKTKYCLSPITKWVLSEWEILMFSGLWFMIYGTRFRYEFIFICAWNYSPLLDGRLRCEGGSESSGGFSKAPLPVKWQVKPINKKINTHKRQFFYVVLWDLIWVLVAVHSELYSWSTIFMIFKVTITSGFLSLLICWFFLSVACLPKLKTSPFDAPMWKWTPLRPNVEIK